MDDLQQLVGEARRLSGLIDAGVQALRQAAVEVAEAEHAYRLAKARAWHEVADGLAGQRQRHGQILRVCRVNMTCISSRWAVRGHSHWGWCRFTGRPVW